MVGRLLFDWDEANVGHIARHGITPVEAEGVIRAADVVAENIRQGESRAVVVGETASGRTAKPFRPAAASALDAGSAGGD